MVAMSDFEVHRKLTSQSGPTHLLLTHTGVVEVGAAFGRGAND